MHGFESFTSFDLMKEKDVFSQKCTICPLKFGTYFIALEVYILNIEKNLSEISLFSFLFHLK